MHTKRTPIATTGLIVGALIVGAVAAGCGATRANFDRVDALVTSLTQGHVSGISGGDAIATKQYQSLLKTMGVRPTVVLANVTTGSADLRWSWPVPGGPWTYETVLPLTTTNTTTWAPLWSLGVVIPGMSVGDKLVVTHSRGTRAPILLSDGKPVGNVKLGGLATSIEQGDDTILGGIPGTTVTVQRPGQTPLHLASFQPTNGRPLTLTINRDWQELAERILNEAGPEDALIAIRPSTGAILASAGNAAAGKSDLATWAHSAAGSTWKTVDSLALIRDRHFTPNSIVTCPLHYTLMGFQFKNDIYYPASALGDIPLKTAVANSCNTAMISQHQYLTYADLKSAAETLGLTVDHNVGFPAFYGQMPPPVNEFIKAEDMIGQGDVSVSPMAMAADIATIERGSTVVPWLIQGMQPHVPAGVKPLTATEDAYLKAIFHQVVVDGTGSGLQGLPGGEIIAKTGTAEFIHDGQDINHTWMIAAQGNLAVACYFNVGNFGADTSGPLLRQFMAAVGPQ